MPAMPFRLNAWDSESHISLASGVLETKYTSRHWHSTPIRLTPENNPGHQAQVSFLAGDTSHALSHMVAGRIKYCPCDSRTTGSYKDRFPGFSWTIPYGDFSYADFSLYPSAVINHNWE